MNFARAEKLGCYARILEAVQSGWGNIGQFGLVVVQLSLLLLVIRQFQIENPAFLRIALLTGVGFLVHMSLPLRYRLPFFVLLSLAGIGLVFGVSNGAWLVGIGLVLIGLCHLPLPFAARVGLLLLIGAGLAVLRVDWLTTPWSQAIWPILGSMFMFRLMVYLYDLQHDTAPISLWRTLAYFFLLPNVCFPLFPVVDYKTFRRTYYDADSYQIYLRGTQWMTRGIVQLLLYRTVYYYFTIAPFEVQSTGGLVRYLLANFLLYLRISGQFHLIVGMLHLFGFHLPETHHHYYLASSFTDYWRRINIYWKDFMLKLFYYPAYFQLRRWGNSGALVGATFFVFVATWFLHAYQWFWLRGSFPLTLPDALFWGTLALLVVINSLYEVMYPKSKSLSKATWTWRGTTALALRTAGTFVVICVLWSLWTSESVSAWVSLMTPITRIATGDNGSIGLLLIGATLLIGGVIQNIKGTSQSVEVAPQSTVGRRQYRDSDQRKRQFYRSIVTTTITLIFLSLLGLPIVYLQLESNVATVIHTIRSGQLSRVDTALLERGYYEDLLRVDRFNSQLWEVYMNKPRNWLDPHGDGLDRFTGDFLQHELLPSFVSLTSGILIRTNRWGMRDQDYEQQPPPGTYRIALLGASTVMGWGVQHDESFEALLESRLNREHPNGPYARYEILNFAVSGYTPLQQRMVLEKAFQFNPKAAFYMTLAGGGDAEEATRYLAEVVRKKIDVPYENLREMVQRAGLKENIEETEALRRLDPLKDALLEWLYRDIVRECRARSVLPVWIFVPQPYPYSRTEGAVKAQRLAKDAGFTVIDLSDIYSGYNDVSSLRLAEWDHHHNAKGHQLIAERLYEALRERDEVLALGLWGSGARSINID